VTNEDAEINQRLVQAGGRIYLSREIHVRYYPRGSFASVARQYWSYGRGRARTFLKHRRLLRLRPVLPFAAIVAGSLLLLVAPQWAFGAGLVYALVALLEAMRVGLGLGLRGVVTVWALFPTLQLSQGLGFAAGLWRYGLRPDWRPPA
jgi:hypothetical protein